MFLELEDCLRDFSAHPCIMDCKVGEGKVGEDMVGDEKVG